MKLKQAIQILKDHNTWRRFQGANNMPTESYPSMAHPRELGIAIDTVVWHFETKNTDNNCLACGIEIEHTKSFCVICHCKGIEAYKE
jgi:hypothetical protein